MILKFPTVYHSSPTLLESTLVVVVVGGGGGGGLRNISSAFLINIITEKYQAF